MKERTLFVTDLDGTLLNADSKVSENSVSMLNEAIDAGALVSVATARTPATVCSLLEDIRFRLPLVVMTGAALWDPRTRRYIDTHFHNPQQVRRLLYIYRKHNLPTFIYTLGADHRLHIYHTGPLSDAERVFIDERAHSPFKTFHVPENGISELPAELDNVMLLFAMQPADRAAKAYEDISSEKDINTVFYHDIFDPSLAFIEAFPSEATKAKGIARLRSLSGATRTTVFGDNRNDLPMFEVADESIAVGNAVEEVRRRADRIIGLNTSDSVAREILSLTHDTDRSPSLPDSRNSD